MIIITPEELNDYLIEFLGSVSGKDLILYNYYKNLYLTGLRANELKQFSRWSIINGNQLQCLTEKGSLPRIFLPTELTEYFYGHITKNTDPWLYNSYQTFIYYFGVYRNFPYLYHDSKRLAVSLFRHNKAKLLKTQGLSDTEIQEYFGEVDLQNMRNYIYSEIYVND